MMQIKWIAVFFLFITALLKAEFTFAGGGAQVGNGGNAVVCKNRLGKTTYELLDLFEAREIHGLTLEKEFKSRTPQEGAALVLERMAKVLPQRAALYKKMLDSFFSEAQMKKKWIFRKIPDANQIAIPEGCELRQVAVQIEPMLPGDKRYFLDESVWEHMDPIQQSALILHEIVYRDALAKGQENSVSSRRLVGIMMSSAATHLSLSEYINILSKLGIENKESVVINLLLQSNAFNKPQWNQVGVQVQEPIKDESSGAKYFELRESKTFAQHKIEQKDIPTIKGNWYVGSVYAKLNTAHPRKILSIGIQSGYGVAWANFDLAKGKITKASIAGEAGESFGMMKKEANGWIHCALVTPSSGKLATFVISMQNSTTEHSSWYVGDGESGIFFKNAQVGPSTSPSDYVETEMESATAPLIKDPQLYLKDWFKTSNRENEGYMEPVRN